MTDQERLMQAFRRLSPSERKLITCALAGNHPPQLSHLRMGIIIALAKCDQQQLLSLRYDDD